MTFVSLSVFVSLWLNYREYDSFHFSWNSQEE